MTATTERPQTRHEAAQADLARLGEREAALRGRLAALARDLTAARDAATGALLDGAPAQKAAARAAEVREQIAATEDALAALAQRRTEAQRAASVARYKDQVAEWATLGREIAEREARIHELFRPIREYERLPWRPDEIPDLAGGVLHGLYARQAMLRRGVEYGGAQLGLDWRAVEREIVSEQEQEVSGD